MARHGYAHDADNAVLFHIGNFVFHTYAFTMMLGMLISILTAAYFWYRQKYPFELFLLFVIVIIPSSIAGARLWFVLGHTNDLNEPWYAFWQGGLAIQGAVIAAAGAALTLGYFHRHTVELSKVASMVLPNVLIGQVIGRWGNFANHEVFGHLTNKSAVSWLGPWITENMFFNAGNGVTTTGYYVPLFLYESTANFFGWLVLVWFCNTKTRRSWFKPGTLAGLYFFWYGSLRVVLEPQRNASDILMWGPVEVSVVASLLYIFLGSGLVWWFQFYSVKYKWSPEKYDWVRPFAKVSKRAINAGAPA